MGEEQAGLGKGRGTRSNIFVMRNIMEKRTEIFKSMCATVRGCVQTKGER